MSLKKTKGGLPCIVLKENGDRKLIKVSTDQVKPNRLRVGKKMVYRFLLFI